MTGEGPSHSILGTELVDEWRAIESIQLAEPGEHPRSGYYRAERPCGSQAFVKAIDFHHEERAGDLNWLSAQSNAFLNEQRIHEMLTALRIRGIAALLHKEQKLMLDSGEVVHYFIVEWCGNDLEAVQQTNLLSLPLHGKYRILHQIFNTVSKMHWHGVAHRDLRQANTLVRSANDVHLTDFGVSSRQGSSVVLHDNESVIGDPMCAPYEALYGARHGTWLRQNVGCDLFLLGSLAFQLVVGFPVIQVTLRMIDDSQLPINYVGEYEELIPVLINAQAEVISSVLCDEIGYSPTKDKLIEAIVELCHPDPTHRGRRARRNSDISYDLQRYVSLFDEMRLKELRRIARCG